METKHVALVGVIALLIISGWFAYSLMSEIKHTNENINATLNNVQENVNDSTEELSRTMQSVQGASESAKAIADRANAEPTISKVKVNTTNTQATIEFYTDIETISKITINTPIGDVPVPKLDIIDLGKKHTVTIKPLLPGQTYDYEITVTTLTGHTKEHFGRIYTKSLSLPSLPS